MLDFLFFHTVKKQQQKQTKKTRTTHKKMQQLFICVCSCDYSTAYSITQNLSLSDQIIYLSPTQHQFLLQQHI